MGLAKDLPNIWPTTGLTGFELSSPLNVFLMGCAKLVAISFTVAGGLRGGYIFPLMCAGSAFGRFLYFFLPSTIPVQIVILCTAVPMNVAITRTTLATTLILAFLPGEPVAVPPLLMSAICSLFATSYMVRNRVKGAFFPTPTTSWNSHVVRFCFFYSLSLKVKSQEVILITVCSTRNIMLMSIVSLVTQATWIPYLKRIRHCISHRKFFMLNISI